MSEATCRPDARKTLFELRDEWCTCIRCELGKSRIERDKTFVFGRGTPGGMLFIGEGPGDNEEKQGLPFVGPAGNLLHTLLDHLGLSEYYETNIVCCRSCAQAVNHETGLPQFKKNYEKQGHPLELKFVDVPPTPPQYKACLPRLHEEIYLVDPILIVCLGNKSTEALLGKPVTITRERGTPLRVEIPGASFRPVLTDKEKKWLHRIKGVPGMHTISEQNTAGYFMLPALHPSYVRRNLADHGADSPYRKLIADLRTAVRIYDYYREIVFGILPAEIPEFDEEALQNQIEEEG